MITQDLITKINTLSTDDCLLILHELEERLGIVSINEYCNIMNVGKRATYYNMVNGKVKYFSIGKKKLPLINS